MTRKRIIAALSVIAIALVAYLMMQAAREDAIPKPHGYYRIALPDKTYAEFTSLSGFRVQLPQYSNVEKLRYSKSNDTCWFDVVFPRFNARLHCTHLPIKGNLENLLGESYDLLMSHDEMATGMQRTVYEDSVKNVYGMMYDLQGEAASPLQFFLTDSTHHFFRGSLYFFNTPNPDSVAPVLHFIRQDIEHLTQTMEWK